MPSVIREVFLEDSDFFFFFLTKHFCGIVTTLMENYNKCKKLQGIFLLEFCRHKQLLVTVVSGNPARACFYTDITNLPWAMTSLVYKACSVHELDVTSMISVVCLARSKSINFH